MKKSLSTILVFLNLLVSPWLGCYADSTGNVSTKTTVSCVGDREKKATKIEEKMVISVKNMSVTDYIHSKDNNIVDVVLKNGETLKIAVDSDVKISIPKLKEQIKKESSTVEKRNDGKKISKNKTLNKAEDGLEMSKSKDSFYSKIKDFWYTAVLKFLSATMNVLPQYLVVKYL